MAKAAPDELYHVLEALKPALKSMDIRNVAVCPSIEEPWQNLVTSIYLTEKSVPEVIKEQNEIPKFHNNQFEIFFKAIPFSALVCNYEFFPQISTGEVNFDRPREGQVQYRKFDPFKLKVRSTQERIEGNLTYIFCTSDLGEEKERDKLWPIVEDQQIEAKRQGFRDIFDLIRQRLKIVFDNRNRKDFELIIPSLAKIEGLKIEDSYFEISIKAVSGLTNLQLNVNQERWMQGRFSNKIWGDIRKKEIPQSNDVFYSFKESFNVKNIVYDDTFNVELINWKNGLTWDASHAQAPLKNVVEPFLKTTSAFCPIEKFQQMLFEPENCGNNSSKIFENAVAWLLSFAGYNIINLGFEIKKKGENSTFDVLRNENGYQIGSTDIIAYEENRRLFLLDCDIGYPDDKKINKLIKTEKFISNKLNLDGFEIIPVLITPKDYEHEKQDDLRVINRSKLEIIFKNVLMGEQKLARDNFYSW